MTGTLPPNQQPRTARPSKFESLELDMDFLDSWDPERSIRARNRGKSPGEAERSAPERPIPATASASPDAKAPHAAPQAEPAAKLAPPAKPVKPPAKPAPAPAAAARKPGSSTLSDERIRELHEKLVRIKRENNESGQVSVESLAKTLRATEEKLRAEHKNRRIEFEVVLRDGKAVVKPRVR
jgi:hypothetical protein